ncbi:HISTIDINE BIOSYNTHESIS 6B, partial [Prunus dulcis]
WIDIYNASSLRLTNTNTSRGPSCAKGNKRRVVAMASTIPVQQQVKEGQQRLIGDSFIRPHLKNLSPYQSILSFESLSFLYWWCWMRHILSFQSQIEVAMGEKFQLLYKWLNSFGNGQMVRVGYGAFPLTIIEYLWRAKQPYNVSVAAEVSACAALENPTYLEMVKEALLQERERLYNLVKELPLNPYPSYSNFILCEVTSGMDAKKLKVKRSLNHKDSSAQFGVYLSQFEEDLAKMGVMIRHYSNKELSGYVHISVGKPEHTDVLIDCLRRLNGSFDLH